MMEEGSARESEQSDLSRQVSKAVDFIQSQLHPNLHKPSIGIICGSGLGGLADIIERQSSCELKYEHIPFFPKSTGSSLDIRTMQPKAEICSCWPCW